MSFFSELKRRNVFRAAVAYLVGTWVLLQVVDVVAPILDIPQSASKLVLLLLALGFVPMLLFSWVYEITPEGIKRQNEIDVDASIAGQTGRKLNIATICLVILALAVFTLDRFVLPETADVIQTAESDAGVPKRAS